jgi:pimeloyl-ACP methyl ester carboxylesterase
LINSLRDAGALQEDIGPIFEKWAKTLREDDYWVIARYGRIEIGDADDPTYVLLHAMGFWNMMSIYLSHNALTKVRFSRMIGAQLNSVDRAMYAEAEGYLADAYAEATRNGPHGLVEDLRLLGRPSGLDYAGVQCPVHLWHGDSDSRVPLDHAKYVAKLVPKAQLEVLPRAGHFHNADFWRGFFQTTRTNTSW